MTEHAAGFGTDDVLPIKDFVPETAYGLLRLFAERGEENVGPLRFGDGPEGPQVFVISPERYDHLQRCGLVVASWMDPAKTESVSSEEFAADNRDIEDFFLAPEDRPSADEVAASHVPLREQLSGIEQAAPIEHLFEPEVLGMILGSVQPGQQTYDEMVFGDDGVPQLVAMAAHAYHGLVGCAEIVVEQQRLAQIASQIREGTFDWSQTVPHRPDPQFRDEE